MAWQADVEGKLRARPSPHTSSSPLLSWKVPPPCLARTLALDPSVCIPIVLCQYEFSLQVSHVRTGGVKVMFGVLSKVYEVTLTASATGPSTAK